MTTEKHTNSFPWQKLVVFLLAAGLFVFLYRNYGDAISLDSLAEREQQLRDYQTQHPWSVYGIAFCIYVVFTGLSIPGASLLSLAYGWYFGFVRGVMLVSFASTLGATIAFLLCRYLFREFVERRFGDRLVEFDKALEREGAFYLFMLRLIPAVPFFAINAVMGLTKIRTSTFYWVSQVGMIPGTLLYLWAGSRVPSLQELADKKLNAVLSPAQALQITIAFALLGLFPLALKKLVNHFRREDESSVTA